MKKLFTLFTLLAMFAVVGCNENGGDNINPNEKPTGERIASVEEQMEAIAASLPELKAAASALGNLVDALSPNNVAPATRTENNSNNGVKDQIAELEERIEELEEFIANGGANKEWLDATYATLEMYEETIALLTALQAEVDALKEHISGSTYDLFAEVDSKIESSCESMKEWINEQLSGYYNIAEVDALLSQLEASLTEDSAELRTSIEELRESLQHSLGEMREEYKAAIAEAIGEYDGVITEKIASEIEAVNERIDSEIAALNKRLDDIEARLEELENAVTNLINRIQSITYVPTHEDGKARVDCHNASIEGSTMTMDFIISPKSAVADIAERYEEILSVEADIIPDFTQTVYKTVELPVIDCTADTERGVISVTVACDNLSDSFFTTKWSARAILTISDGNNDRNTEYIELFPRYYKQANNMIKYTTWDRKPIAVNWKHGIEELQLNTYDGEYGFLVFYFDVSVIPEDAFAGCDNLTTVSLPTTITEIRTNAFKSCNGLGQIDIPEGVISIGDGAFMYCTSLTSITIPDSVTSIGAHAFEGCFSLPVEDGMIYADTYLVEVIDKTQSTYTIKEGTRFINEFTFSYCENLTSIIIPDSVTSIGNHAFFNCTSLTSITIPDSVTEIGNNAFYSCLSLMSISLPNSLNSIEYNSFANCISLTSITIPDSVTEIGAEAFANCISLTSITIPDSVTEIGAGAFISCTSLTSVTIPDSVTEIGESAFCDCTSLTSVTIPESVVSIGDDVFDGCTSLSEFKGGLASADGRCLIIDGVLEVFIPVGLTEYTIPDGVAEIGDRAFGACRGLTSITIPDSVTSIGSGAFVYCTSLTSLTIPDSVTSIGDSAFGNCSNLTNVTIGNGVTEIGEHVFSECRSLTSITIPNSITSIGEWAFSDCSSLTSATIGNGVTSIGEWAFYCCTSLTRITIPDSVTKIGASAFSGCESLAEIYCESLTPATITKSQTWVYIWGAFDGNALGRKIYVPTESVDAYKTANGWKEYADDIVGYDFE